MTEQEIAEEQRRNAEAIREAKKALMNEACWDRFFRFFQFAEVSWLAQCFFSQLQGRDFVSKEEAMLITGDWIDHRWGNEGRSLQAKDVRSELIPSALELAEISADLENWELPQIVVFAFHYQDLHLEMETSAGFAQKDAQGFKDIFDDYDKDGTGIRNREIWDILRELGFDFSSVEEQKELVDVLKKIQSKFCGSIDFRGLLHLLRKIMEKEKKRMREREYKLIIDSGMALEECEEWLDVFQMTAGERVSVDFGDMRRLFEQIGVKWDLEGTKKMAGWLKDVDEDANGQVDFGEFCCLVNKMWTTNFANIKQKSAEANANRALAPQVLSAKEQSTAATDNDSDPLSPTPARRRQIQSSWVAYLSEMADRELDPMSPSSKRIINEYKKNLSRQG